MRPNRSTAASTSACAAARRRHVAAVGDGRAAGGDDLGGDGGGRPGVRALALHRAAEVVDDDARAPVGQQARRRPGRCRVPRR